MRVLERDSGWAGEKAKQGSPTARREEEEYRGISTTSNAGLGEAASERGRSRNLTHALVALFCVVSLGCGDDLRPGRGDAGFDGGEVDTGGVVSGCDRNVDSDGDGIADAAEGTHDTDGDGIANHLDDDSDGDGLLDRDEHGDADPCTRPDTDADGMPNWSDLDSDNDGLLDGDEVNVHGTDPLDRDSDGDGITDLGEVVGTMTDPNDSTSTIPPTDFFVVLPFMGSRELRTLRFGTNINVADIYFLIDTTGSMGGPIDNVQTSLSMLSTEIGTRIPDAQLGVGHFEDFPMGGGFGGYGSPTNVAYENDQDITDDVPAVQRALDGLVANGGADGPESHVEAMFQTATGLGGSWTDSTGSWSLPRRTCEARLDEPGMRTGYPCFRPGSLPIIVMVTDVNMHNGPGGSAPYVGITPEPHTFPQAVSALRMIGARFIGVAVNGAGTGRGEMEMVAEMTGTVDGSGSPLVYDASGGTVSTSILDGIGALTGGVAQDVTTRTENVPGNPDEFDATLFIKSIRAVEGYDAAGIAGAGYGSKDDVSFYDVIPGTQVEFEIDFWNDVRPPAISAEIFQARIIVVGNGVADLDGRNVYIIVPPEGGTILI